MHDGKRPLIRTAWGLFLVFVAVAGPAAAEAEQGAQELRLRAGFARRDITPAPGAEMPGGFNKHLATAVHDPLYVEVAWIGRGDTSLALAGVDACMVPANCVAEARRLAAQATGIPGSHVLIGASHTHNGGPLVDCFGSEQDPAYTSLVAQRIAEAIGEAAQKAVPARVGVGLGHEDGVGFNRRFKMKDGTYRTHPGKTNPDILEPAGPIDPDVAVLAFQDAQGALLGCVVNHALHGTVMGGPDFSADWICYLRSTLRGASGADMGVVFLNGACGDVTQVDNRNPRPAEFGEAWARRIGTTVGAEALKVLARMEFKEDAVLDARIVPIDLPIRDLAESDEALLRRESPASGLGSGGQEVYLREAMLVREMKAQSPTVRVEIQAARIGDAALVTNPAEFFAELGLAIKRESTWNPTMVVELANGYAGYVPTEKAFSEGGYETRTARSSFLAPGAGESIVEESVALLKTLGSAEENLAGTQ